MMWIRSKDNGNTWSRPKPFPIVPGAYGVTDVIQMRDGTMVAIALIELGEGYRGSLPTTHLEYAEISAKVLSQRRWVIFRSDDNGEKWSEVSRIAGPFLFPSTGEDMCQAPDGALLLLCDGSVMPSGSAWPSKKYRFLTALLRSENKGKSWKALSVIGSNDFNVEEGAIAYLPNGSLGFASRMTSAWFQSHDNGQTWSAPRRLHEGTGALFKKGDHVATPDGVNVIMTCGGSGGNGQVLYTRDSGKTWIKPTSDRGFIFNPHAYYPDACVLEDGSIFAVGDRQGFENKYGPYGAEVTAMRFRIKSHGEGEGIELLPMGEPSVKSQSQ